MLRTREALSRYDALSSEIDAYQGASEVEAGALFHAWDLALCDVAEAFAHDTRDRNDRAVVVDAVTHGGSGTGHYGAALAWVRGIVNGL